MPSTATAILDGLSASVAVKAPCRTVATSNITLSGLQTISGYTTVEDDRVLVKGQTNPVDNGIYMASTGSWTRAKDADGNRDLVQGTRVLVRSTTIDGVEYELTTANPIVIGTTELTFTLRYGANATYDQTEAEIAAGKTPINYAAWARPIMDVSRYVSDNTGATDVSAEMADAFASERNILIPEGIYQFDAGVVLTRSNLTITGANQGGSGLAGGTILRLGSAAGANAAILRWSALAENLEISRIGFHTKNAGLTQRGLRFAELRSANVQRCRFEGVGSASDDTTAILFDGTGTFTGGVDIERNYITNHLRGIDMQGICTTVRISRNEIYGTAAALGLETHGIHIANTVTGASIENNGMDQWKRCVYSEGQLIKQMGNYFEGANSQFEWVRGSGNSSIHNLSIGDTLLGAGVPVFPTNPTDGCVVLAGPGYAFQGNAYADTYQGYRELNRAVTNNRPATITYSAGDFTGSGGTWTVDSGDVDVLRYWVDGSLLYIQWDLNNTVIGGSPGAELRIALPAGFTIATRAGMPCRVFNNATWSIGWAEVQTSGAYIRVFADATKATNWTAGTAHTVGQVAVEIA